MKIHHLNEAITELNDDQLIQLLKTDYSQAHQAALNGQFIYKGMFQVLEKEQAYFFNKIENRKSANTHNYYTLWINNSHAWSEFPKRNVIATTNYTSASEYGFDTYVILPKNGSKIGVCPLNDIWVSFKGLQKVGASAEEMIEIFNYFFKEQLNVKPESFNELGSALRKLSTDVETIRDENKFSMLFHQEDDVRQFIQKHGFAEAFKSMFSPKGFNLIDINQYKAEGDHELWFDSDFIAINYYDRKKLLYRDVE